VRLITSKNAQEIAIAGLGLAGRNYSFSSAEVLSALLRRSGAFNCPCPPSALVRTTLSAMNGIHDDQQSRDLLPDLLEEMVSYGDFIESRELAESSRARLLYVVPPAFVEASTAVCLIMGISADDRPLLPEELEKHLELRAHVRLIESSEIPDIRARLIASGFRQIPRDEWVKAPRVRSAADHVRQYDRAIEQSERPGTVDDLMVLNTALPVRFYRGRWESAKQQTGRFVARRPQPYGAPLWAVVELLAGKLIHLVDLPVYEANWRPCDEAWHLQQAMDAEAGNPQLYRVRPRNGCDSITVDMFSPIPAWAQRRWNCVGKRVAASQSLMAYEFRLEVAESELQFARERMWLSSTA